MSVALRATSDRTIVLPEPRGPWTEELLGALAHAPGANIQIPSEEPADSLGDDDLQLALYVCYELHYADVAGVDDRWEWAPALLAFRRQLEDQMETGLAHLVPTVLGTEPSEVGNLLQQVIADDDGPPLSRYMEMQAELAQVLEQVVHRSAYQLKEADPHSWAIPRLSARPKAALLEVQFDEYGAGRPERMHSALFAKTMTALGLDSSYGAYVGLLPGITLAGVNLISYFGLHRRLRGALVGHLAAFEMTSSIPNRRYGNGLRRLGYGTEATHFYDEHVEADAVHESIAAWDLAGGLARVEPHLANDILFGAHALLSLEARWAQYLLDAWREGRSSLLRSVTSGSPSG
jgi:hypothetical protein